MLDRPRHRSEIERLLAQFPVVAILGGRQVGKTTLARAIAAERSATWFDLESPRDAQRLSEPQLVLESLPGLVVLDEIQRLPEIFPLLRVLADRGHRYLVLGSASRELLRQTSESLAGRVAFHEMGGFDLEETGSSRWPELWLRGGHPPSFLADDVDASLRWRDAFVDTFLARDLPALGSKVEPSTMRRFWTMLAHYHGQIWNGAELARAFGTSEASVRRYLDTLESAFAVRVLSPWHENMAKRQVKSPKVYVRDVGLLHALLGLGDRAALEGHPKIGASWEGFALAEVIRRLGARAYECYFWATHQGAELDLLVVRGSRRLGFEFKRTAAPRLERSMGIALRDLGLERIDVVFPGSGVWPVADRVRAVGIADLTAQIAPLQ